MAWWLLKSEPSVFSIGHLAVLPEKRTAWDGVRNYQARNYLKMMRVGDEAFFYHSSCETPGIVGVVSVVGEARPDPSQFDPSSPYFDSGSSCLEPRWVCVDVELERVFDHVVDRQALSKLPNWASSQVMKKGNRLSVLPVDKAAADELASLFLSLF